MNSISLWLRRFLPDPSAVPLRERALSAGAAGLAVLAVAAMATLFFNSPVSVIAALGASACIVFCLPASPLAQPWAVIGGYLVSGLIGVAAAHSGLSLPLALALATGGSIFAMLMLRCLHPPGGAVAMIAVIGGEPAGRLGLDFVLMPVLSDALLLVVVALLINNWLPGRHYPRRPDAAHPHRAFSAQHLHAALDDYGHPLAMSEEELDAIITLAENRAKAPAR